MDAQGTMPTAVASLRRLSPWYTFVVLELLSLTIGVETGIVSLLAKPIESSLHVGDAMFGVLAASAITASIALVYFPSGILADVLNRRNVMIAGVVVWAISSLAAARSDTVAELFAARFFEGIGIGITGPASYSVLSDTFPIEKRALVVSLYLAGGTVGAGVALWLCGAFVSMAERAGYVRLPLLGVVAPWQMCFVGVFLLSIALVALLVVVTEPRRIVNDAPLTSASLRKTFDGFKVFLRKHGGLWVRTTIGVYLMAAVFTAVLTWTPTLAQRVYHVPVTVTASVLGSIVAIAGLIATIATGAASQSVINRGRARLIPASMALMCIGFLFVGLLFAWAPTYVICMVASASLVLLATAQNAVMNAAIQDTVPPEVRGQLIGVMGALVAAPGLVTPAAIGFLSDSVFKGLQPSFAVTIIVCGVLAYLLLAFNTRSYMRAREDLTGEALRGWRHVWSNDGSTLSPGRVAATVAAAEYGA